MAQEVIQYRVCDRCNADQREVTAESTDKLILNGHRFDIDLCRDCSAELYTLVMHTWGALGVKTGEPTVFDAARPISTKPPRVVHPSGATEDMVKPGLKAVPFVPELPHTAQRWHLTDHAEQRMTHRGFTLQDVLMACERPNTVLESPYRDKEHCQIRKYGRCLAVVDPLTFSVLTVLVDGENKETDKQQRAEA